MEAQSALLLAIQSHTQIAVTLSAVLESLDKGNKTYGQVRKAVSLANSLVTQAQFTPVPGKKRSGLRLSSSPPRSRLRVTLSNRRKK